MASRMHFRGFCSDNCELKTVLVHEEALCRLRGEDVHTKGKWLCDEVSPNSELHESSIYFIDADKKKRINKYKGR